MRPLIALLALCVTPLAALSSDVTRPDGKEKRSTFDASLEFTAAYRGFQQADQMLREGRTEEAIEAFGNVLKRLEIVKAQAPDWEPLIVEHRLTRTRDKLRSLLQPELDVKRGGTSLPSNASTPVSNGASSAPSSAAKADSFQDSPPAAVEPSKAPLHKDIEIHAHENAMSAVTQRGKVANMRVFTRLDDDGKTVSIFKRANTLPVGGATISRSDVGQLVAHLNKFLEWEQTAARERLDNIRKPIGEVGIYSVAFEKKETETPFGSVIEGKGLCELWRRDRPTSEGFMLERLDAVYLVSMLDNLDQVEKAVEAKESNMRTMQDKADKLLQ
jgi:hypothetical protein